MKNYDIYSPQNQVANDIIYVVHGGGFVLGDKSEMNEICEMFCERGMIAVACGYRLCTKQLLSKLLFVCLASLALIVMLQHRRPTRLKRKIIVVLSLISILNLILQFTVFKDAIGTFPDPITDVIDTINELSKVYTWCTRIHLFGHSAGALTCLYASQTVPNIVSCTLISGVYDFYLLCGFFGNITMNMFVDDEHIGEYFKMPEFGNFMIISAGGDGFLLGHTERLINHCCENNIKNEHLHVEDASHWSIRRLFRSTHFFIFEKIHSFIESSSKVYKTKQSSLVPLI